MAKKEYLELKMTLDDLLDIPDSHKEIKVDEHPNNFEIEIEPSDVLTTKELEESMSDVRGINSMKDLRPDDYKGVSINVSKLFNMFKNRKG